MTPPVGRAELERHARERLAVREWRAQHLHDLGVDELLAFELADAVDWHDLAMLVDRGCPVDLALRILL